MQLRQPESAFQLPIPASCELSSTRRDPRGRRPAATARRSTCASRRARHDSIASRRSGAISIAASCPAVDQLPLQLARFRLRAPSRFVRARRDTRARAESDRRRPRRVRPERGAESLVGPLMPVHEIANLGVFRFVRTEVDAPVVAEREQQRGAGLAAALGEGAQPLLRHQIEQRGRGDDGSVRKSASRASASAIALRSSRPCLDFDRRSRLQRWLAPAAPDRGRRAASAGAPGRSAPGSGCCDPVPGAEVEDAKRGVSRGSRAATSCASRVGPGRPVRRFAQREPGGAEPGPPAPFRRTPAGPAPSVEDALHHRDALGPRRQALADAVALLPRSRARSAGSAATRVEGGGERGLIARRDDNARPRRRPAPGCCPSLC